MGDNQYELMLDIEAVEREMGQRRVNKTMLAELIGVDKHTITRIWRNPENVRLRTIADIAAALKYQPEGFIAQRERRVGDDL